MLSKKQDHSLLLNPLSKCHFSMSSIKSNTLKKLCGGKGPELFGSNKEIKILKFSIVNLIHTPHHQGEILTTHVDISNAFTSYYSQIFGAPHCLLLLANWDILYHYHDWSFQDTEHPFNEEARC